MSNMITLDVQSREIAGKQVKHLRSEGLIPGVVYGPTVKEPLSVQVKWTELRPVLADAGGTSLINLTVEGQEIKVLVRNVQRDPVRQEVIHIDFLAVDTSRPIRMKVPLVAQDRDLASKRLSAKIFQPLNRIEIECLPEHLPPSIPIDLSKMTRPGHNLTVGDLEVLEGVTYLADDDLVTVRSVSLVALMTDEESEGGEESEDASSPEVEVIRRGKEDEEEDV